MAEPFNHLELLAPARDLEVGRAAIAHGADAVYIGGPGFGARAAAGNSIADIEALCSYAHRFHARVFMALNTLIYDDEFEAALRLAHQAYEAGVDALILQDMGLMAARSELPPIELHASTQCDIRTPEKAAFLDALGFSQVVLARELTLEEIARCRAAMPRARIEFFVHGALCVSYSGRCYLSCAECSRSANRGACAQPCRLPYTVTDTFGQILAQQKHVLSLKDNDQSAHLAQLVAAGVSSFKIEGRLKDADYVKNITAHYRRAIDRFLEQEACGRYQKSSLGKVDLTFEPNPAKTFHRSETDYFLHGRHSGMASLATPKSTGEFVGRVTALNRRDPQSVDITGRVAIANGDGLVYFDASEMLSGLHVNRAEVLSKNQTRLFLRDTLSRHPNLTVGSALMRNRDTAFAKALEASAGGRRMPVTLTLKVTSDEVSLTAQENETKTSFTVHQAFVVSEAKDPEKSLKGIRQALEQTGETDFVLDSLYFDFKGWTAPFIPLSVAKNLRRDALKGLSEALIAAHARGTPLPMQDVSGLTGALPQDFTLNCANEKARAFYASLGLKETASAFEVDHTALDLSEAELMRCRYCIRHELGACPKLLKGEPEKKQAFKAANGGVLKPKPLILTDEKGRRLIARFDCRACEMTISLADGV